MHNFPEGKHLKGQNVLPITILAIPRPINNRTRITARNRKAETDRHQLMR